MTLKNRPIVALFCVIIQPGRWVSRSNVLGRIWQCCDTLSVTPHKLLGTATFGAKMFEENLSADSIPEIDQNLDQLIDWLEGNSTPRDRGRFGSTSPTETSFLNKVQLDKNQCNTLHSYSKMVKRTTVKMQILTYRSSAPQEGIKN
jgi:hypothetical protein